MKRLRNILINSFDAFDKELSETVSIKWHLVTQRSINCWTPTIFSKRLLEFRVFVWLEGIIHLLLLGESFILLHFGVNRGDLDMPLQFHSLLVFVFIRTALYTIIMTQCLCFAIYALLCRCKALNFLPYGFRQRMLMHCRKCKIERGIKWEGRSCSWVQRPTISIFSSPVPFITSPIISEPRNMTRALKELDDSHEDTPYANSPWTILSRLPVLIRRYV